MKHLLKLVFLVFLLSGCQKPTERDWEFTSLGALFEDQTATALIKAERYEDALSVYINMLEKEPNKPQIHSNIAVIMSQIQKPEDALKSWDHALKLAEQQKDATSFFAVNFNLGAYYGAQKKIDQALKYYQAALDVVPTSIEAKTNIELLLQSKDKKGQGEGQNENQDQQQNQDQQDQGKDGQQNKDQKDQKNQQDKDQPKDQDDQKKQDEKDKKDQDNQKEPKKMESSAKYKPRPYQGDQLNEGDVKKILGELRNQEQKIRANFDKKERKDSKNEKDW